MRLITLSFYLAGLINIVGMLLIATPELTDLYNSYSSTILGTSGGGVTLGRQVSVSTEYPAVFSPEGCFCIMLWGLAYISVASKFKQVPLLCLVFCIEKVFYTLTWFNWYFSYADHVFDISQQKPLLGLFFQAYGFNDGLFAVIFFIAFLVGLFSRGNKLKTH